MHRHGKIVSWINLWDSEGDEDDRKILIQIAKASDGSRVVHILKPIRKDEGKWGFTLYQPSYKGMRVIIDALVEIYGKEEVEKKLGVKIE